MSEPLSKIPNGLRYYAAREAGVRRIIEATAMTVFQGWSYEEILTPTVDYYSLFEQGMGEREAHRAFRFTDGDGRLLALRPDVTSSIARAAATLFVKHPRPLRLCYAATVFHQLSQSPADWRRESTQIGCELLGRNSKAADMEILAIAAEVLRRLGLNQVLITLSDVEIFNGIVENLRLDSTARDELRRLVDIRAVAELECFLAPYASAEECSAFADLIQLSGKQEIFNKAYHVIANARSRAALERLESLWRVIESLGMSGYFEIDLGDVTRLDYYTGLTFKIYVEGVGARVGSGGRYDNLTARFGTAEPAVGFVLELDPLAELLAGSAELIGSAKPETAVLNPVDGDVAALFREAIVRRASDERVEINADEVTTCRS
jgi:ATP phosphoribosyltransferase regulatory subunit